jgi:serine/threonine-protein kinase
LIGQTLGKYRIIERLGQGENAVVYKAHQTALNRFVTLKILEASNREGQERLRRESQVLARFQHSNIRQVYSIESHGPFVFAVLEYAEKSLKDLLNERRQKQPRPFTRTETVEKLRPIAEVLDYLHGNGWVHLDIKPQNILVTAEGRVLLADFGVAQPFGKPQSRGTPAYVAPEVVNGDSVHAAADIYSFGVVAYEMLALRLPFTGENDLTLMRHHTQTLPPKLDQVSGHISNSAASVVNQALAKAPHRRYATAAIFVDMLDRADTASVRLRTLPKRRPIAVAAAAVSLACVLTFGGVWGLPRLFARPLPTPPPVVTLAAVPVTLPPTLTWTPPAVFPTPVSAVVTTPAPAVTPSTTLVPTKTPAPTFTTAPSDTPRPAGPACTNPGFSQGATITEPAANASLQRGPIVVRGTADLPNSVGYEFQYRSADRADEFHVIDGWSGRVQDKPLGTWNASALPAGNYVLRLRVNLRDGNYKDCDVPITLQ